MGDSYGSKVSRRTWLWSADFDRTEGSPCGNPNGVRGSDGGALPRNDFTFTKRLCFVICPIFCTSAIVSVAQL
jgi:hypothetical protein